MTQNKATMFGGATHRPSATGDKGLIVLAAGGTGGHVFPALAVAATLRERGYHTILFTDKRGAEMVPKAGDETAMRVISAASPFQGSALRRLLALGKISAGMMAAVMMMIRRRPLAMIGFGGYPSFGPMAAAKLLFVPMMLHEQNGFLGRANRALARLAGHLALSWSDTANLPDGVRAKVVGMPVRAAFFAGKDPATITATGPIRVLIIGGSQGAAVFADMVPAAIATLDQKLRARLQVSQQCRDAQIDHVTAQYADLGVSAETATFFDDMPRRIAECHLVITRSGASAVAELAAAGRPALMIPLPGAMDDHQTMNARQLEGAGAGLILPQGTISPDSLGAAIGHWLADPAQLTAMGRKARNLARPDAAAHIADYALSLIGGPANSPSCKGGPA